MPGMIGSFVSTPLPGPVVVVGGLLVVVGAWKPMVLTQTLTLSHRPVQSDSMDGFHRTNCASVIPFLLVMIAHVSPLLTKSNPSQLSTMPGWVGSGVSIPFPGAVVLVGGLVVVGGSKPTTPTQTLTPSQSSVQ